MGTDDGTGPHLPLMSLPTFVDRASALPEANSIGICRLDGGWVVKTSNNDVPMACQSAHEVLQCTRQFLAGGIALPSWEPVLGQDPPPGSNCQISKIDGGYLITVVYSAQSNAQFVRFRAGEVLLVTAHWLGLTPTSGHQTTDHPEDAHHERRDEPGP